MQKKTITCPKCGTPLEVTNPNGQDIILINCPQCQAKLRVQFNTGETVLEESSSDKKKIGSLSCKGIKYPLQLGLNTIGRKSNKSTATIQIDTDDRSVSRVHAEIEVVRLQNERIKVVLRDIRDSEKIKIKPSYFEDQKMYPEDRINLENGDTFKIGETLIKYVQK